jgi:hypothetical protein
MKKKVILFLFAFLSATLIGFSQSDEGGSYRIKSEQGALSLLSFHLTPGLNLPMGEDSDFFNLGGGVGIAGEYRLRKAPLFFISGNIDYNFMPVNFDTSVSVISFGAGGGINYELIPRLELKAFGSGGYFTSFLNDGTGPSSGNPFMHGGAGVHYFIIPALSLGLESAYTNYFGLYSGIGISLGVAYHLPAKGERPVEKEEKKEKEKPPAAPKPEPLEEEAGGEPLQIRDIAFEDIFPVFFKYYDDHPVGRATLLNSSDGQITDIAVHLFVKQYMDNPKICKAPTVLGPGEESEIELHALFTNRVLDITEGTKVSAQITLEFSVGDEKYKDSHIETIRLYDRNATTWDDDRKAAAFVTAKDPAVLTFSKNIAGLIKEKGSKSVNQNLRMAIALHEALDIYGMSYVIDPTTPYIEFSQKKTAVDFLQFPRQSFQYKAGDCDDLSILYSSLLESVGIETAFITMPGHLFMAFSVDMTPAEARKSFLRAEDFIFKDDDTWIPVEVTERDGGFLKAWQTGAKQWREATAREQEGFFPIHEAWKIYEPVGLTGARYDVAVPSNEKILNAYLQEVITFIDREIYPKLAKIQAEIKRTGGSPASVNKLGVLYARYGLMDRAQREFLKVLETESRYVPALLNMGNVYYLQEDMETAEDYYNRAYEHDPDNPKVLLTVARVNHEMENYGTANKAYRKLKDLDPDLAGQFAYLDLRGEDATRAAAIGRVKEVVLWEE